MERWIELEQVRRSLVMQAPGTAVWTREQAVELIEELQDALKALRIADVKP